MPAVPLIAAAFVAGSTAGAVLGGPWWATLAVATAAAGASALWRGRAGLEVTMALVLVAMVAAASAGHARVEGAREQAPPALATLEGTHEVVGVVRDDPRRSGTLARVDLRVEMVDGEAAEGGLRLTLPAPREPLRTGDRISAVAEIERPPELEDFDYARFLRSRGIHAVAAFPERWSLIERDAEPWAVDRLRGLRRWALANIDRSLPEPEASLAAGMLLGRDGELPADLDDALRRTGTTHLLVVSGQNVALLLGSVVALGTAVVSRRRAALIALALLPAYVLLVGAEPPVVRAAIMAVGIALAAAMGRRTPGWVYLLYAVAAMLALRPLLVDDVAFQLSASATAGVLLVAPPMRDLAAGRLAPRAGPALRATIEAGAVATAAGLAVLPVQAASFGQVSVMQVPANVLVAPLYEATLVVALAAALLGWLEPPAEALYTIGSGAPGMFVAVVEALGSLDLAVVSVRAPLVAGAAWYTAMAAGVWWLGRMEPRRALPGGGGGLAATPLLAGACVALWLAVLTPGDGLASVSVLDVGQGQAVLVRDGEMAVLIDAGPPDGSAVAALSRVYGGRHLDAVVITHEDRDHSGGLDELERRMQIDAVLDGEAGGAGSPVAGHLDIGDRIHLGERTTIEVLSPPVVTATSALREENNRSLVLLVTIGERRVLVAADIEAPAEEWLVRSGLDLHADVLVVPHHGSRSSSTPAFVDSVSPSVAVISVGAGNPHGHPHPEVLDAYASSVVLRTDLDGDVTVRSDGERMWVQSAR